MEISINEFRTEQQSLNMEMEKKCIHVLPDIDIKSQEYIDHALLGPEFMANNIPSSFIIDLIENRALDGQATFDGKQTNMVPEMHNNIFLFANKQDQIKSDNVVYATDINAPCEKLVFQHKIVQAKRDVDDFFEIDNNFLSNRIFHNEIPEDRILSNTLSSQVVSVCDIAQITTQKLPSENEGFLNIAAPEGYQEIDVDENLFRTTKKILPHKKRLSRKLNAGKDLELTFSIPNKETTVNCTQSAQFSCELCSYSTFSQLQFFTHLKGHYEPQLETQTHNHIKKEVDVNVDKVFKLNFDDFQNVVQISPESHVAQTSNKIDDIQILACQKNVCMNYVTKNVIPTDNAVFTVSAAAEDDLEFSDTEDMLEGIRNVVDKVSIEDTCDELDMINTNNLKTSWFSNINSHDKYIDSVSTKTENNENTFKLPFEIEDDGTENCVNSEIINFTENDLLNFSSEEESEDSIFNQKTKQFECVNCNRYFNSSNALKYHSQTHTGKRPHQCDKCGKSFLAHGALKSHMKTHFDDKPFECENCLRTFRQIGDLKYHKQSVHSGKKSYQCEFCGKSFSRKYSLVVHRRIHTSEQNYKCEFCPKRFRASSYLQNHRKLHTGEKPHKCNVCGKSFRVSGDLSRHWKIHQKDRDKDSLKLKKKSCK